MTHDTVTTQAGDELSEAIRERAVGCALAALDKKATDVTVLDVRGLTSLADYFILASARSDTQVRAIAEAVEETCKRADRRPISIEGLRHGQWALLDYGDLVVHVFYGPVREFYDLERLWSQAPRLAVPTNGGSGDGPDLGEPQGAAR